MAASTSRSRVRCRLSARVIRLRTTPALVIALIIQMVSAIVKARTVGGVAMTSSSRDERLRRYWNKHSRGYDRDMGR
jgi:hypothetical protein